MCDPITLSGVAVGAAAASAGLGIHGQRMQKKSQEQYNQRLMDANAQQMQENRDLATRAYLDQVAASNTQLSEAREAVAASNFDKSRQAMEAKGAALASAAEAGIYGVSLTGLLDDFNRQEAMFRHRNEQNLVFKQQANALTVRGHFTEALGRTAQIKPFQPGPVAPVDYLGPILQVVQTGATAGMKAKAGAAKGSGSSDGE